MLLHRIRLKNRTLLLLLSLACLLGTQSSHALPYYFEFGGGMATLTDPSPVFSGMGKSASTSESGSVGIPLTFGLQLQNNQSGLLFSLALQHRYITGNTGAGESYTLMTTGPMLRIEFWRLVLGAGYTPFAWKDITFGRIGAVDSVITYEAQFLFPITIEIDFGLQASRQIFTTSLGTGPNPSSEYGAFFRLNFGFSEGGANQRRKFKGWRYPFGNPLD